MVHPTHVLPPGGSPKHRASRVSFASTVLLNLVNALRLSHAQKPNRYRARGTAYSRDCDRW
jgi:hypothetical protein